MPHPGTAVGIMALVFALFASPARAEAFKLLSIGDSLSDEYGSSVSVFFSAPDTDPFNANTSNWVELLHQHRPGLFSMGIESSTYLDYRYNGYEYNYGSVGFKAEQWDDLLHRNYSWFELLDPGNAFDINTRRELKGDLGAVDAVLIFIGGNDLSLTSDDAENDRIRTFIGGIHDYVRDNAPDNLPIIVATVPDIGVTPKEKLLDPAQAEAARARVATLNTNIIADLGARANTHIVRIDSFTDRIWDQIPFQINGTEFVNGFDRENPPLYLFCKEEFHPSTVGQALIANEILLAINSFAEPPIPLFTNREILGEILSQDPDQPLLDYMNGAGDDNDSLPPLLEFLLGKDPAAADAPLEFEADGTARYHPSEDALRFADLYVLQSETLMDDWTPVPEGNIQNLADGTVKIIPSGPKLFYKFEAIPKP